MPLVFGGIRVSVAHSTVGDYHLKRASARRHVDDYQPRRNTQLTIRSVTYQLGTFYVSRNAKEHTLATDWGLCPKFVSSARRFLCMRNLRIFWSSHPSENWRPDLGSDDCIVRVKSYVRREVKVAAVIVARSSTLTLCHNLGRSGRENIDDDTPWLSTRARQHSNTLPWSYAYLD